MGFMLTSPASAGNISSSANGVNLFNQQAGISASNICAGSAYCNGEVNGSVDAFTFGPAGTFAVSNSFTLAAGTTLTGAAYGVWNFPGDSGGSVDWTILSGGPDVSAGGTVVASGHAGSVGTVDLGTNSFGFDIQVDSFSMSAALAAGTYYLELQNATVASGDPVYWDEADGSSIAWQSTIGYINTASGECSTPGPTGYCSESFAVYGGTQQGTPEPGTLVLGGSGLLLLAGALRRKLNR